MTAPALGAAGSGRPGAGPGGHGCAGDLARAQDHVVRRLQVVEDGLGPVEGRAGGPGQEVAVDQNEVEVLGRVEVSDGLLKERFGVFDHRGLDGRTGAAVDVGACQHGKRDLLPGAARGRAAGRQGPRQDQSE